MSLEVGKIYRLRFPGIAARVLPDPPDTLCWIEGERAYLIETLFLKHRWWVTAEGKPNNYRSPWLIP